MVNVLLYLRQELVFVAIVRVAEAGYLLLVTEALIMQTFEKLPDIVGSQNFNMGCKIYNFVLLVFTHPFMVIAQ